MNQLVEVVLVEQIEVGRVPGIKARHDQVELLLGHRLLDQSGQQLRQIVFLNRSFQVCGVKKFENVDVPSVWKRTFLSHIALKVTKVEYIRSKFLS